jgi:hypothetical protein
MGITLSDRGRRLPPFFVNFWHWRTIVEAVRRLEVLPVGVVDRLHEQFTGSGLAETEARQVAAGITQALLTSLRAGDRLLLDGTVTQEVDDGTFHRVDEDENYGTNREVLAKFAAFCEACAGFDVD